MSVKTCTKCRQKKPLEDFRKHPNTIGGRHTQCRGCLRAYSRAYYYKKKENRHEKNLAPNRLGAPRRKSAQAVNEVAVMAGHRMTPGEAADRLRLAEKILHDVYNLGGADHRLKKRLNDTAGQINLRIEDFEEMERKTRNALA
ncbi:hypothetical protein [Corynebacterium flavescens]|uniref:hypothetical protein n=1 Tax=Corynebacterium flavescens TaxID=28028 RepID=UPI003FD5609D